MLNEALKGASGGIKEHTHTTCTIYTHACTRKGRERERNVEKRKRGGCKTIEQEVIGMKERTTRGGPSFNEFRRCVVVRVVGVVACRSQNGKQKKGKIFKIRLVTPRSL